MQFSAFGVHMSHRSSHLFKINPFIICVIAINKIVTENIAELTQKLDLIKTVN